MFRSVTRLVFAASVLLGSVACGNDPTAIDPDLGLPTAGAFRGALLEGEADTTMFTAARTGEANVGVCGPAGTNFELQVAGIVADSPSNCERLSLDVVAGATYRVIVSATGGAGPYYGCFASYPSELVTCTFIVPLPYGPGTPAEYYDPAIGLEADALIAALNDIIDDAISYSYDEARDSLYETVEDPNADDVIETLYTGRDVAGIRNRATAGAANLNAEHLWPQSRGAAELPANSDLHILFATDAEANQQRSNHPFGEVTGSVFWTGPDPDNDGDVSRLGQDDQGRTVFEPRDDVKGDVARAVFYFFVRYSLDQTPSFSLQNFAVEEETLLEWHELDPPDDEEIARNNLIFRIQGNRNPFVDYPLFVDMIGDFPN